MPVESGYRPLEAFHPMSILLCKQRPPTMQATSLQICGCRVSVRCMVSWTCLFGLMFFTLELSLSRMASQSHSRSWSVTGAHVQGRLKGKIKHLMSEMNLQLQQLCFFSYHLTCIKSPRSLEIFLASLHVSPRAHRSCLSVSS